MVHLLFNHYEYWNGYTVQCSNNIKLHKNRIVVSLKSDILRIRANRIAVSY